MCTAPALAEEISSGCAAANSGAFNADLTGSAAVNRQISLAAGDVLTFSAENTTVTLTSGTGAPAALIAGGTATAAVFKASAAETYVFKLSPAAANASVRISCSSAQTEAASAAFLERRKAVLNERDPDRLKIDRAPTPIANSEKPLSSNVSIGEDGRAKGVEFSVSLSEIAAAADGNKKADPGLVDFWVEGRMQNYSAGGLDSGGNLSVLYLGTRSMLSPDIMLGALAQLDRGVESSSEVTPEMAARGWMFGPYMSMKLGPGVVFDTRAAWGATDNVVDSAEIDDTSTARRLVRGKLTGTRDVGGWTVAPSIGLVYVEDAVRDSTSGETKAAGTGKVQVLPEISKKFAIDDQTFIEPRAALGAFVGFDNWQAINPAVTSVRPTDLQLKAEAGVAVGVKDGTSLQATGGVESGSASAADNWMGRLQLSVPLSK